MDVRPGYTRPLRCSLLSLNTCNGHLERKSLNGGRRPESAAGGGSTQDFWNRVSQQMSYIDGSTLSSLNNNHLSPQTRSISWHLSDGQDADGFLELGSLPPGGSSIGAADDDDSFMPRLPSPRSLTHSPTCPNLFDPLFIPPPAPPTTPAPLATPGSELEFLAPLAPLATPCSLEPPSLATQGSSPLPITTPGSLNTPGSAPTVTPTSLEIPLPGSLSGKPSVVELDSSSGNGATRTRVQKQLSFGDTLDTTTIYTPEDEFRGAISDGDVPKGKKSSFDKFQNSVHPPPYQHAPPFSQEPTKKASSWEESEALQRRKSVDGHNFLVYYMERDLRYYFQHPYARLFVTYFVIFCNFLLFAEDPVSHSHTESDIPMVGNVFSFVLTKYPPEWRWSLIKVLMWLLAILCGMILGKLLIHGLLCGKLLRLKMFRDDQGSWMTMFLTVIVSLYVFSHAYNVLLVMWYPDCEYLINSAMGVTNASVMKAAACGTWLGDLITALMVTDMMLQDNLYPKWSPWFRQIWRRSNIPRILIFWVGSVVATSVVVTLIVSDWISWDKLNKDFVATTEVSRAFLASFILVMDLLIVMQDWDFPHFTSTLHVNLPGFSVATLQWKYAEVDVTGKWFNYGIIFLVMILDLNMWKNQMFFNPQDYGQYVDPEHKVWTVSDKKVLDTLNQSLWTWVARSRIHNETNKPFYEEDMQMNSRYMGYPVSLKWTAFIPSVVGLLLFIALVSLYGRFPPNQGIRTVALTQERAPGGRIKKWKRSSWRRERSSQGFPDTSGQKTPQGSTEEAPS